jgi:hypothetical protein
MDKELLIELNRIKRFYQVIDNVCVTPPRTHFAQYLRYVGQICHSLICFLFSITINVCFYKKFIITCFKKSLFEQKNDSNEYKYRSFYTNNHIFVLGKNRFISPYCSGSFCPKLRTGADNAAY